MRYQLTPSENLLVGMFSGTLETSLQMPLITWKFCKQEGRAFPRSVAGCYRGLIVQAGSLAPITGFQVLINGILERLVTGNKRNLTRGEQIGNATVAGMCSSVLYGPADLILIHQQKLKMNPVQTVKHLISNHGMFSIFRGMSATAVREAMYVGGALGLTPVCSKILHEDFGLNYYHAAGIGSLLGGIIGSLSSHPVDTAKTCMQADIAKQTYANARAAGKEMYQTRGVRSLYLGGLARTLRASGAFFVLFNVREYAINYRSSQMLQLQ